jgi:hypothetical protein
MPVVKCKPGYGAHFYRRDNSCAFCGYNKNIDPRFDKEKEEERIKKLTEATKNSLWRKIGAAKLNEQ